MDILHIITDFYLTSRDFNGIPLNTLIEKTGRKKAEVITPLICLIKDGLASILLSEFEVNTHILRTGFPPKETQLSKIEQAEEYHTCIYPTSRHLCSTIDQSKYDGRPYELAIALGEPQLAYRSFDLSVLETYRNDPRYYYSNDDVRGSISVRNHHYESGTMPEQDQVLLETFGFSYDAEFNRSVATYLGYLADLSPEHQQLWKTKELTGDRKLHPDYYRNTIVRDWGERVPILTAFVTELYVINKMAEAMNRPPFFRIDYGQYGENVPVKFSLLVRPTLEEFNNFVLLLDKLLSENINLDFFQNEVPYEETLRREDGNIEVRRIGSLNILTSWFQRNFQARGDDDWLTDALKTLKEVRKLRQKPAHSIDENIFDQKYFKQQRELIIRSYTALSALRLAFANHPLVVQKAVEVPDWLFKGNIWDY